MKMLMVEKWPVVDKKLFNKKAEREFRDLQEFISKIRNLRASYRISPSVVISSFGRNIKNIEIIEKLARVKIGDIKNTRNDGVAVSAGKIKITLDISEFVDTQKEKARIKGEIENLESLILKNKKLLENKNFLKSAPKNVVVQNKTRLLEYQEKLKSQRELLGNLG